MVVVSVGGGVVWCSVMRCGLVQNSGLSEVLRCVVISCGVVEWYASWVLVPYCVVSWCRNCVVLYCVVLCDSLVYHEIVGVVWCAVWFGIVQ